MPNRAQGSRYKTEMLCLASVVSILVCYEINSWTIG